MEPSACKSVLEIGCGRGENSRMLAERTGMNVLGTDLCVPFIERAKQNNILSNLKFEVLDFNSPDDFLGQRFDYIVGNGILHHLYFNLDAALKNMLNLLKAEGKLIFMEPNLINPYIYLIFSYKILRNLAHLEPAEMAFTKKFATEKLEMAGFKNIQVEYRDFLLPGVPDWAINPSIHLGEFLEKTPIKILSQSLGIVAEKQ
jgi:2-polyprenyl-3-methyl-5-hydroxy-6-metoxy-1,4-benzoquinol methylase